MMDQGIVALRLPGVERLFQGIEHEVRVHGTADPPAHDAPGKHINDEGDIEPALPGRDVGEVRHPELVGTIRLELEGLHQDCQCSAGAGQRSANSRLPKGTMSFP